MSHLKRYFFTIMLAGTMILLANMTSAQELPPRPMRVIKFQDLRFGAFVNGGSGGKVTINANGTRTPGGNIYLMGMEQYHAAIFEVEALPGNIIHVILPLQIFPLKGSRGGELDLVITEFLPENQIAIINKNTFINTLNPSGRTKVFIGGELTIGNSTQDPAGNYIGTFHVTFMQE